MLKRFVFSAIATFSANQAEAQNYYYITSTSDGHQSEFIDKDSIALLPDQNVRAWIFSSYTKGSEFWGARLIAELYLFNCVSGSAQLLSSTYYAKDLSVLRNINTPASPAYSPPGTIGATDLSVACNTSLLGTKKPLSTQAEMIKSATFMKHILANEFFGFDENE